MSASLSLLPVGGDFSITLVDSDQNLDTARVESVTVSLPNPQPLTQIPKSQSFNPGNSQNPNIKTLEP